MKKILHNKKGAMYVDTAIGIFVLILCIFVALSIFILMFQQSRVNELANNVAEYASLNGYVGTENSGSNDLQAYVNKAANKYGLKYSRIEFESKITDDNTANIDNQAPYGSEMNFTIAYNNILYTLTGAQPLKVRVHKVGISQAFVAEE